MVIATQQKVRSGYRHTEVGVIPEDWEVQPLATLISRPIQNGVFNEPARKGRGCKLINVGDLYSSIPIDSQNLELFDAREDELSRFRVAHGDIFFTRSSLTPDGIAHCNIYEARESGDVVFDCHIIRVRANTAKIDPLFLFRYCSARVAREYLVSNAKTTTMTTIDQGVIAGLPILVPPLREQRVIASVLSDVDALTASLDVALAKKRDIKTAAMQQLLTGKQRLPGFSGAWLTIRMAEDSVLKARIGWQGLTTAEYLQSGDYYLVTGTDFLNGRINWESCCFVDRGRYSQDINIQLKVGDVLLTKDGTIGKVGYVDTLPGPATLNSGVFVIRPKSGRYDSLCFYYVMASRAFDEFLAKLQAGSTISHLYQKDFVNFSFPAPSVVEQTAIAAVLSDIDADIAALQGRRDKTEALKQGMMQQLLTGSIRLV